MGEFCGVFGGFERFCKVLEKSKRLWGFLGGFGGFWGVLGGFGGFWEILGGFGGFWGILGVLVFWCIVVGMAEVCERSLRYFLLSFELLQEVLVGCGGVEDGVMEGL